jgi:hypothetical protein
MYRELHISRYSGLSKKCDSMAVRGENKTAPIGSSETGYPNMSYLQKSKEYEHNPQTAFLKRKMCSRTLVYAYFTVVSIASYQIPFRDK